MNLTNVDNRNFIEEEILLFKEFYCNSTTHCVGKPTPFLAILEMVVSVVGLVLNGIAMFIIIMLKDYKKSISHWYVLQLAIADSLFLAMLPLRGHEHLNGKWLFSDWACHLLQAVFMINYYAGIFFLTVMSVDRYAAIVHPVSAQWRRLRTHGNAVIITIVVWILSVLCCIPLFLWSSVQGCSCGYQFKPSKEELFSLHNVTEEEMATLEEYFSNMTNNCETEYNGTYTSGSESLENDDPLDGSGSGDDGGELYSSFYKHDELQESPSSWTVPCYAPSSLSYKVWLISNFLLMFILPLVVMAICYSCILWRVIHPAVKSTNKTAGRRKPSEYTLANKRNFISSFRSSLSSSSSVRGSDKLSQKQKVTAIVVSLIVVFIISWLPFQIVRLLQLMENFSTTYGCMSLTISTAMAYANSMLNPIFYTFLGSRFCHRFHSAKATVSSRKRLPMTTFTKTRSARSGGPAVGRNSGTAATRIVDASAIHPSTFHSTTSKSYPAPEHYDVNRRLLMKQRASVSSDETR